MISSRILIIILFAILVACRPGSTENHPGHSHIETGKEPTTNTGTTNTGDSHNAALSLDWKGTYKGVTPCADCQGIEVQLVLQADQSYTHQAIYLGKGDSKPNITTGSFNWNEAGNTITLVGISNGPNQFFVAENKLVQLDMQGNKVGGALAEKYVLTKQ